MLLALRGGATMVGSRRSVLRGAAVCAFALGCSSPQPSDTCGPSHATFRLVVDAADGPVPEDVTIHVKYGSGEETFDATMPAASLKVVFCQLHRGADGGSGPIESVACDLWTDGAATVTINGTAYAESIETLEAEREGGCLLLSEAHITLERE